jgi:hypothetical protein
MAEFQARKECPPATQLVLATLAESLEEQAGRMPSRRQLVTPAEYQGESASLRATQHQSAMLVAIQEAAEGP